MKVKNYKRPFMFLATFHVEPCNFFNLFYYFQNLVTIKLKKLIFSQFQNKLENKFAIKKGKQTTTTKKSSLFS
jgi:hypothetical protein